MLTCVRTQVEIVEDLASQDSPVHALNELQSRRTAERHHGKLEEGSGSKSSGTYAKPC